VGLAAAKGLSEALGKPVVAVSNLQALAWYGESGAAGGGGGRAREQVYGALYTAELELMGAEVVAAFREWIATLPEGGFELSARMACGCAHCSRERGSSRRRWSKCRAGWRGDCADCGGAAPGWRSAGPGGGRRQLREAVGCGVVLAHAIMGRGEDTVKALAYIGLIFGALVYGAGRDTTW